MEEKPYKAHVLILPFPGAQGHITPMLQFSKRLLSKGIKVTLVTTIFTANSMHVDPTNSIPVETISDGYDTGGYTQAESIAAYSRNLRVIGSQTLAHLISKLHDNSGQKIAALIYDGSIPWALDVAKQFGIIGAAFFTQSCAVNNVYYHVNRGLLPLPLSGDGVSLPGLPTLKVSEVPSFVYTLQLGLYQDFFYGVVDQFSNVDDADWVLFNTFYKLEEEGLNWMGKLWRLRTIGPTVPSMYLDKRIQDDKQYGISLFQPNTSTCMDWLNSKPSNSVVYVSFGSMAKLQAEQMEELAWGLKKSNYYFLWVVRALEEAKLPKNITLMDDDDKGLVVTWSPQLEVLSHASIGCFLTHCGFNSVLEALSLGVPMVAMPLWTDQCTNGKYVEDVWGVGVRVWPDEKGIVRREVIELSVREVMEGEKGKVIKENACKWRNLAKEAVDEGGSSDKNIDEFVAALVCSS